MMVFSQIELLPIAYFLVLLCVVCANVLAKYLGKHLVAFTTGQLHQILVTDVHLPVTADTIEAHLYDERLIRKINQQLQFNLHVDFTRWMSSETLTLLDVNPARFILQLYPQIYWSGCPPSVA